MKTKYYLAAVFLFAILITSSCANQTSDHTTTSDTDTSMIVTAPAEPASVTKTHNDGTGLSIEGNVKSLINVSYDNPDSTTLSLEMYDTSFTKLSRGTIQRFEFNDSGFLTKYLLISPLKNKRSRTYVYEIDSFFNNENHLQSYDLSNNQKIEGGMRTFWPSDRNYVMEIHTKDDSAYLKFTFNDQYKDIEIEKIIGRNGKVVNHTIESIQHTEEEDVSIEKDMVSNKVDTFTTKVISKDAFGNTTKSIRIKKSETKPTRIDFMKYEYY